MPGQPFLGEIYAAGYNFAPLGYALCNGALLSIQQNTALFSLLGTTYGGDGIQTFALPDLRSRVPLMFGQGNGLTPYSIGDNGGVEDVTITQAQMPQHGHQLACSSANGSSASPAGLVAAKSSEADKVYGAPNGAVMNGGAIGPTGGNQPHENRQPFLALNYYIALQGIFPSRN
jgi:microcystin-dependent protein